MVRKDVQAALAKKNMQKGLYTHLYKKFREKYWTEIRTRRYRNSILNTARTARDMLNRKGYVSARVLENEDLKGYLKFVANLKGGADIKADVRERVAALKKVYNKDNFALYDENAITGSELDENIVAAIDLVAENAGSKAALTADELRAIDVITKGLVHLYKNYDLMWRGDSTVSVRETAGRGVEVLQATARRRQRNTRGYTDSTAFAWGWMVSAHSTGRSFSFGGGKRQKDGVPYGKSEASVGQAGSDVRFRISWRRFLTLHRLGA